MGSPGIVTALFVRKSTLPGVLIRHFEPDDAPDHWTHVGVVVPHRTTLLPEVIEARWFRGVVVTSVGAFKARYRRIETVQYLVPDYTAAMAEARRLVGTGYGYQTALGRAFGMNIKSRGLMCSGLLERILEGGKLKRWRGDSWAKSPDAVYDNFAGVA